jgi:hypothetical protein
LFEAKIVSKTGHSFHSKRSSFNTLFEKYVRDYSKAERIAITVQIDGYDFTDTFDVKKLNKNLYDTRNKKTIKGNFDDVMSGIIGRYSEKIETYVDEDIKIDVRILR